TTEEVNKSSLPTFAAGTRAYDCGNQQAHNRRIGQFAKITVLQRDAELSERLQSARCILVQGSPAPACIDEKQALLSGERTFGEQSVLLVSRQHHRKIPNALQVIVEARSRLILCLIGKR